MADLSGIKSVFGRSAQERPTPNAIDIAAMAKEVEPLSQPAEEPDTQRSELTGLVLVPGFRFNGSTIAPPLDVNVAD